MQLLCNRKKILLCISLLTMAVILSYIRSLWNRKPPVRTSKYSLPLPRVSHLELGADVISDRKLFVIGDVHGCFDELSKLVEMAKEKYRNTLFIFVGDLVNKGPKSKEVLTLLQSLDCYSVRGNHDEAVLKQYYRTLADPTYELPPRYEYIKDMQEHDFEYLSDLPFTISIPTRKTLIVHAGIVPGVKLDQQDLWSMTHMRNIEERFSVFSGTYLVPSESAAIGEAWASKWVGPNHVYFGHDAVRRFQAHAHATGIDTGCVYGNRLTGIFIDTKEIISVESKGVYRN